MFRTTIESAYALIRMPFIGNTWFSTRILNVGILLNKHVYLFVFIYVWTGVNSYQGNTYVHRDSHHLQYKSEVHCKNLQITLNTRTHTQFVAQLFQNNVSRIVWFFVYPFTLTLFKIIFNNVYIMYIQKMYKNVILSEYANT